MNLALPDRFIAGVGREELPHYIPLIEKMYEDIAKKQDNIKFYTVESIINAIHNRDMQFWVGAHKGNIECGMITEIRVYPAAKVLSVLFVAGKAQAYFKSIQAVFCSYAKCMGCSHWTYTGRPGWFRVYGKPKNVALVCYQEV